LTILLDIIAIVSLLVAVPLITVKNLKYCVYAVIIQQTFISILYALSSHILAGVINILAGTIVIPFILYYTVKKTQEIEADPPIGSLYSTVILVILLALGVSVSNSFFQLAVFPASLIIVLAGIGVYGLLLRSDLIKITMALIMLETAVHVGLTYLAPAIIDIPVIGTLIEVMAVFITGVMAYLTIGVYKENLTSDSRRLRRLAG